MRRWRARSRPAPSRFSSPTSKGRRSCCTSLGLSATRQALAEHRRVLREAFERHGGVEVDTQGDAFFVAFASAPEAVAAARDAQDALAIPVRMGIHTGTPLAHRRGLHRRRRPPRRPNRGGRPRRASPRLGFDRGAHGRGAAGSGRAPAQGSERSGADLATRRAGLSAAEDAVSHEPARSGDSLPRSRTRARDGPRPPRRDAPAHAHGARRDGQDAARPPGGGGGVGALSGRRLLGAARAFARSRSSSSRRPAQAVGANDGVADQVGDKQLLLLLDNFEHLMEAADELVGLQASCPNLRVLVTSREMLRLPGEQAYPVPPLEPVDGTELFLARARAVKPDFEPDESRWHSVRATGQPPARARARRRSRVDSQRRRSSSNASSDAPRSSEGRSRSRRPAADAQGGDRVVATICSTRTSSGCSRASLSSAVAARSRRRRPSAMPTSTSSSRSSTRALCASARRAGSGCWRRSASTRGERLEASGEARRPAQPARRLLLQIVRRGGSAPPGRIVAGVARPGRGRAGQPPRCSRLRSRATNFSLWPPRST